MMMKTAPPRVALIPHSNTKVVHFIRHAQGFHNVAGELDHANYASEKYFDAHLTEKGWRQVGVARQHIKSLPDFRPDIVIVSPTMRAMETASGIFGGDHDVENGGVLMTSQQAEEDIRSKRPSVSAAGRPPFLAIETCREQLGEHPCDRRRSVTEYKKHFPSIDFSLVPSDADILWKPDHRETVPEIQERGRQFLNILAERPERHIAVVSHSGFLRNMCRMLGEDLGKDARNKLHMYFQNCEIRTLTLLVQVGASGSKCPFSYVPQV